MNIIQCQIPSYIESWIIDIQLIEKIVFMKNEGIFIVESNVWFKLEKHQKIKLNNKIIDIWQYFEIYKKHIIENLSIIIKPEEQSSIQIIPVNGKESLCLICLSFDTLKNEDFFEFTLLHEIGHISCPKMKNNFFDYLINFSIWFVVIFSLIVFILSVFALILSTLFIIKENYLGNSLNYYVVFKNLIFCLSFLGLSRIILSIDYHWINFIKVIKNYRKELFCDEFAINKNPSISIENVSSSFVKEGFSATHPSSQMRFAILSDKRQKSLYYYLWKNFLYYLKNYNLLVFLIKKIK